MTEMDLKNWKNDKLGNFKLKNSGKIKKITVGKFESNFEVKLERDSKNCKL